MSKASNLKSNIMDIFVNRPVLAIVLSLIIVLMGIRASNQISVLQFPQIESSSLVISTTYTGAAADVVKGYVTEPIERTVSTVPGVDYVDSITVSGQSTVTAWLDLNYNTTAALAELTAKLSQIRFELPAEAEDPAVSIVRADKANAVFYLDVNSEGLSRSEITDYLTRNITPQMSTIKGVQKITLEGGRNPAMRVWIDPDKLAVFNLGADEIMGALQSNNTIATMGYSENQRQRIDLLANTTLKSVSDFEQLVIKEIDGTLIRLADVATIEIGEEEGTVKARFDKRDSIFIAVWSLPGANEIAIGDELYEQLDKINPTLPKGMTIDIGYDGTLYMRDAIKEIFSTLGETVLLVGIVVVAMMGSFRTALVPLITIPISILGAIGAMAMMGFTLNLLTILAIVLSVGLVVDDAIVVVENVARHMREGKSRYQAALMSSRQLLVPVIAMTLTLAAVYAPIGFLSGLTGFLFREFAFTLAIAVIISGVVAITLSPIMSAYVSPEGGKEGRLTKKINAIFARIQKRYFALLDKLFSWRRQILAVAVVFSLLIVPFYMMSQQELAPVEDQSSLQVVIEAPPESSLHYTTKHMDKTVETMMGADGAKFMWQILHAQGGFGGIELVPLSEREKSVHELLPEMFMQLSQISELRLMPMLPPALPTAGQFDVEMVIRSTDSYEEMKQLVDQIIAKAYQSGQFMFLDTDLKVDLPQAQLILDKALIADLGLDLNTVNQQLSALMSNNFVNHFNQNGKAYRVIPIVANNERLSPDAILAYKVRTPAGDLIPVSTFASIDTITSPRALGSFNQQKSFRVYGGVLPHITKDQALTTVENIAKEMLPAGYSVDYAGESRQLRKEGSTLISVLLVSLVIVYFVLTIQFNNFRDPLVVLIGCAPLALAGALAIPFLGLTSINIYSQIGLITLIGLIAKNGILIVEFANHMQMQGMDKLTAVKEAASTRLRPILMTTAATVLGHFPLVLVTGAGAESRNSIGIILVVGMAIGTLFTLVVLPLIYTSLAKNHQPAPSSEVHPEPAVLVKAA